ncbi:DUF424 family protein [Candidatus Woesearchaeota archaeon]|nr:DUF424 family protein [Candidatus Woesearchaeota archaeon]
MALVVAEKEGAHGLLLVVTDSNIIGTLFEEKKTQLDLRSPFYRGKEKSKEEVKQLIALARDLVFTGKEAVALGVELDLVDPQKILYVHNVPHAQVAMG